jgi:S-DNA-T family DNA segregation ATPase FtsK/SpoIIIE
VQLHLTVVTPSGRTDVVVTARPGTPFSDVRADLLRAAGRPDGPVTCDGSDIPPDLPLGLPPLLHGAVITTADLHPPRSSGVAQLHTVGGPDAGRPHALPPGRHGLGRSSRSQIRIRDPDVSRDHAEIDVRDTGTWVRDRRSRNGTRVNGVPVGTEPVLLAPDTPLQVGRSTLLVREPDGPGAVRPDGLGHLLVNRAPRWRPPAASATVCLPARPPPRPRPRLPWAALVMPVAVAVPLSLWWHQPAFLALALTSPLVLLAQHWSDLRRAGADRDGSAAEHARRTSAAHEALVIGLRAEAAQRHGAHPDLATVLTAARGPSARLWERDGNDPDMLRLRIGLGRLPARLEVRDPGDAAGPVGATPPMLEGVPVTLDLEAAEVAGLAGPRAQVIALARSLVAQAAVWHSPRDLAVAVLTGPGADPGDWRWARALPHHIGCAPPPAAAPERARTVLVLDDARALREDPGVADLLTRGPGAGVRILALADDPAALPLEARATVALSGGVATVRHDGQAGVEGVAPDLPGADWADAVARALTPLRDATPDGAAVPTTYRLVDGLRALGVDPVDAGALTRWWATCDGAPRALLGATRDGPFVVDLRRHGPHLLVAGTTGAGKSELARTLVASLAVLTRPDQVRFVLVDYKGGTAFADLRALPHVAGLVTDLDPHLTRRALASLEAELRRREHLLRSAGAADLDAYATCGARPALARLVLVVDEFRVLAEELPEFVAGLVRVATVGRSLGVHLVLATQRPAGVVTADIRANVSTRIALRVRDREDSVDVVDVPDAATIPPELPGRAVARTGAGPLTVFQTAQVGGRAGDVAAGPLVRRADGPLGPGAAGPPAEPAHDAPDDLARIVVAVGRAARTAALPCLTPPWLPPLPDRVSAGDLLTHPDVAPRRGRLPFALADLPQAQAQRPWVWDLSVGHHLLVAGGPRSGRSTTLTTLAAAAGAGGGPAVPVYALDGGGALAGLETMPHVGAVVAVTDPERCIRLIRRLGRELALPGREADDSPPLVLLVDGWEQVSAALGEWDHGAFLDRLVALLRDGRRAGLRAAVAGGRSLLTAPVAALLGERLVLAMADPADAVLAGVPLRCLPERMPPGRGSALPAGSRTHPVEVQVALPPPPPPPTERRDPPVAGATGPWRVPVLPGRVPWQELHDRRTGPAAPTDWALVGLGGDDVTPVGLPVDGPTGALVVGPGGSGRSTALVCLARSLAAAGRRPVLVTADPRAAAVAAGHGVAVLDPFGPTGDAVALLADRPDSVVLVDDPGSEPGSALEDPLLSWLDGTAPSAAHRRRLRLVAACDPSGMAAGYRGVLAVARAGRTGLLLGATGPADAAAFGLRTGTAPPAPPGRGLVIAAGRTLTVQVADPC